MTRGLVLLLGGLLTVAGTATSLVATTSPRPAAAFYCVGVGPYLSVPQIGVCVPTP
jgi:ABC-type transporter lipoprotein component MlaA